MINEIKVVESNQEKGFSYRQYIAHFNKAKKEGFLFECMWILYAMMEDRTTSFFDHLGFVSKQDKSKVTGTKKVRTQIKEILSVGEGKSVRFDSLKRKLESVLSLIEWSRRQEEKLEGFKCVVKQYIDKVDNDKQFFVSAQYLCDEWRNKRNQLMHALLNKQVFDAENQMLDLVEKGFCAIRVFDKGVAKLRRCTVRKKFNIQ